MRFSIVLRAVLLAGVVFGIRLAGLAQSKDTESEILSVMERLRAASSSPDNLAEAERASHKTALREILSDSYVRVSEDGTFRSKNELLGAFVPAGVSAVHNENTRVFEFEGGTAVAICLVKFDGPGRIEPWIVARVFKKEGLQWRLIGEDAGRPFRSALPKELEFPLVARRNPAVPQNEGETELRRVMEQQRIAVDPQAQRVYGRVIDRQAAAKYSSTDYLKVWWTQDGWTNDNGPLLSQRGTGAPGTREQFVANVSPTIGPDDPRHLVANDPDAFLRWENVNVAVMGNTAIVTYRSLNQKTSKRIPAYTVFRVWEKRDGNWLNVFSFR